jgi:hypothetical protein
VRRAIRIASGCLGAVGDRERRFLVAFAGLGGGRPMSLRDAARVADVASRRAETFGRHAVRSLMAARRGGKCTSAPSAALLLLGDGANRFRMLGLPADAADGDYASFDGEGAVTADTVDGEDGAAAGGRGGSGDRDTADGGVGGVTAGSTGNDLPGAAARAGGDESGGLPPVLLFLIVFVAFMTLGVWAMRTGALQRVRGPARGAAAVPRIPYESAAHEAPAAEPGPEDAAPERPS